MSLKMMYNAHMQGFWTSLVMVVGLVLLLSWFPSTFLPSPWVTFIYAVSIIAHLCSLIGFFGMMMSSAEEIDDPSEDDHFVLLSFYGSLIGWTAFVIAGLLGLFLR